MCFRLVSSFERCGHQDTVAHIQLCNKARAYTPSSRCPLAPNDTTDPVYRIRGFCGPCSLNHAVLHQDGHLHEAPRDMAVVYHVENNKKAKARVNMTVSTHNNDQWLVWKEIGGGMTSWGSGDGGWGGAPEGKFEDWAVAKNVQAGAADIDTAIDWADATDDWGNAADASGASPFKIDGVVDTDATGGAVEGSWAGGDQIGGEQEATVEQNDPVNSMAWYRNSRLLKE